MLRVVILASEGHLRIVSTVLRALEYTDRVTVVVLEDVEPEKVVDLLNAHPVEVVRRPASPSAFELAGIFAEDEEAERFLAIDVGFGWKLQDLPLAVNRSRSGWTVYATFDLNDPIVELHTLELGDATPVMLTCSKAGVEAIMDLSMGATFGDLPQDEHIRLTSTRARVTRPKRESLTSATRVGRLLMWMLETRHPLIAFGLPGLILFLFGYRISDEIITNFAVLDESNIVVTAASFLMTLIGIFSIMVALLLYILGKQVEYLTVQSEGLLE